MKRLNDQLAAAALGSLLLLGSVHGFAKALPTVKAERAGMSTERLDRMPAHIQRKYIDSGKLSGALTLVARGGKVVHFASVGQRGLEDDRALTKDALFRIYSMTKPITAVAAMMLFEEGHFQLSDPITNWLPELAELKVMTPDGLVDLDRPITMRHLLTHTAGFSYGFSPTDPLDAQYREAKLFESKDLDELVKRVATLPLKFQPGLEWHYSIAVDLTGLIIERISGQRFDRFLQERIFAPLGMDDTFFEVPADKLPRLLPNHAWDREQGKQVPYTRDAVERYRSVSLYSGGGGLISTAMDYLQFAEMLRNGGAYNGVRLLSPKTVEFMTMNHLPATAAAAGSGEAPTLNLGSTINGAGFGLGFGIVTNVAETGVMGSVGDYSWGGAAGTIFWVDPVEDTITIGMIQQMVSPWPLRAELKVLTNQAIVEPR